MNGSRSTRQRTAPGSTNPAADPARRNAPSGTAQRVWQSIKTAFRRRTATPTTTPLVIAHPTSLGGAAPAATTAHATASTSSSRPPPTLTRRTQAVPATGTSSALPSATTFPSTMRMRLDNQVDRLASHLGQYPAGAVPGLTEAETATLREMVRRHRTTALGDRDAIAVQLALARIDLVAFGGDDVVPAQQSALFAQQGGVRGGMVLDGQRVEFLTTSQLATIDIRAGMPGDGGVTPDAVQYLLAEGDLTMSTEEVVAAVVEINGMLDALAAGNPVSGDPIRVRIAERMHADRDQPAELAHLLDRPHADQVNRDKQAKGIKRVYRLRARVLNEFLLGHGKLREKLRQLGVAFDLEAHAYASETRMGSMLRHPGGAAFVDNTIHIGPLETANPNDYLRMFLHEVGHATFQRLLLQYQELPTIVSTGEVSGLLTQRRDILEELNRATAAAANASAGPSDPSRAGYLRHQLAELERVEKQLADGEAFTAWQQLPADAQKFYRAWRVLRRDKGRHLLGLNLGGARSPGDRRSYQAVNFREFCAETFMEWATGELQDFVTATLDDAAAGDDVKAAWMDARTVLETYAGPILGPSVNALGSTGSTFSADSLA